MNDIPYFFSVIVPLYNKQDFLARSLASIKAQTYRQYEVIIVDDGSTDDSLAQARKLSEPHWNIHSQANAGVSAARNRGVSLSHGKYLCFLDADDEWLPTFLERMCEVIQAFPDAGMWGANYECLSDTLCVRGTRISRKIRACNLFREWLRRAPFHTDGQVIRRDVFEAVGGFDIKQHYYEDASLMFKIALRYEVAVTDEVLTRYYTSVSDSATKRMRDAAPLYPSYCTVLETAVQEGYRERWFLNFSKFSCLRFLVEYAKAGRYELSSQLIDGLPGLAGLIPMKKIFTSRRFRNVNKPLVYLISLVIRCYIRLAYVFLPIKNRSEPVI